MPSRQAQPGQNTSSVGTQSCGVLLAEAQAAMGLRAVQSVWGVAPTVLCHLLALHQAELRRITLR